MATKPFLGTLQYSIAIYHEILFNSWLGNFDSSNISMRFLSFFSEFRKQAKQAGLYVFH